MARTRRPEARHLLALLEEVRKAPSALARARLLVRSAGALRRMSREERLRLLTAVGFEQADELVDRMDEHGDSELRRTLQDLLARFEAAGPKRWAEMARDLREPEGRSRLLRQGLDLLAGPAADEEAAQEKGPEEEAPEERGAIELPRVKGDEAAGGPLGAGGDEAEPAAPGAPVVVPVPPGAPSPPRPPDRAAPGDPASAAPGAGAPRPAPPPTERAAGGPEPPPWPESPPPGPAESAPATAAEGAVASPPAADSIAAWREPAAARPTPPWPTGPEAGASTSRPSTEQRAARLAAGSVVRRLSLLRHNTADLEDAGPERLRGLLDGFPSGWPRRRALETLLRAGIPADVGDALELVETTQERPAARLFCLGALASRPDLGPEETEQLLAAAVTGAERRRLTLRLARHRRQRPA